MNNTATFKKGDVGYLISNWDRRGSVVIVPAMVVSCGKKRMHLQHKVSGLNLGSDFRPSYDAYSDSIFVIEGNVVETAEAFAKQCFEDEKTHLENCITAEPNNIPYIKAMQKKLDAMHEIRIGWNRTGETRYMFEVDPIA